MRSNRSESFKFVAGDEGECNDWGVTPELVELWNGDGRPFSRLPTPVRDKVYDFIWHRLFCHVLPSGIDYMAFDSAIVCGVATTARWLQQLADCKPDSALTGYQARGIVHAPAEAIEALEFMRRRRQKVDHRWSLHAQAWTNRTNRVKHRALKLVVDCKTEVREHA